MKYLLPTQNNNKTFNLLFGVNIWIYTYGSIIVNIFRIKCKYIQNVNWYQD